jgi:hypothetical protein
MTFGSISICEVLLIVICAAVSGCGSDNPFEYVPVSGKVSYDDGSVYTGGQLQFESQAPPQGNLRPRPATAAINSDGSFDSVTSYKPGDGLVPGKHKVAFIFATDAQGKPLVPQEYMSVATSPLVIDTADAPLTIKVPKP